MAVDVAQVVVRLTAGAFLGACLYIALVQHPARTARGGLGAVEDFRAAIPRAEKLQAPLLVTCLVAVAVVLVGRFSWTVAVGGLAMATVLVMTVLTVLPINRRLLAGDAADHLPDGERSLRRWGTLHAVRTALTLVGAVALAL